MFTSVANTASELYSNGRKIYSAVNSTVSGASQLLNRVSGGRFAQTGLASSIRNVQNKINRSNSTIGGYINTINTTAKNVNEAVDFFGSLLKTPVGEKKP